MASAAASRSSRLHLDADRVHLRPVEPDRPDPVGDLEPHELTHVLLTSPLRHCPVTAVRSGPPYHSPGVPRSLERARRTRPRLARAPRAARRDLGARRRPTSPSTRPRATRAWVCLFDDDGRRDPPRADRAHPRHLARRAARRRPGTRVRLPGRRAVGPRRRAPGSTRPSCCSTPSPARSAAGCCPTSRSTPTTSTPPSVRSDLDSAGHVPLVGRRRPRRLRLGRRAAQAAALARHRHLRAARQGHDRAARPGARAPARHVRRPRRRPRSPTTCATSASPPSSCCRCTTSSPSRRSPRAGWSTTGATTASASSPRTRRTPPPATAGSRSREFKEMVRAFHAAGIEVYLDVVYNHTAEAGPDGPTLSFRGLDDQAFYRAPGRRATGSPATTTYWDATGCGNTVDTDDPFALRVILDSLRYWADEMHVDGFRFDLLSALARTDREVDMRSRFMTAVAQDPVLRGVKLIAEPWDATMDGYNVGNCPPPWVEWNDQYRDTMRDFWRGAHRRHPRGRDPAGRVLRPVRRRRALAVRLGQLRHRPRRLHRARPGQLRPQAQRGQRRGQPRRHRRQPLGQPRRRGRDRRRRRRRPAPAHGGQPDGHAVPVQRRPDDHRRRRARPHPARQQQRLLPGQRDLVGRLARRRRLARRLRGHQGRAAPAPRAPRAAPAALVRGPAHHHRRTQGPRLAAPRRPRDDHRRLARRVAGDPRHVRPRHPAALPRPARRAAVRPVLRPVLPRRRRPGRPRPARQPLGALGRGRALHRPGGRRSARAVRTGRCCRCRVRASWCCARPDRCPGRRGGRSHALLGTPRSPASIPASTVVTRSASPPAPCSEAAAAAGGAPPVPRPPGRASSS